MRSGLKEERGGHVAQRYTHTHTHTETSEWETERGADGAMVYTKKRLRCGASAVCVRDKLPLCLRSASRSAEKTSGGRAG